MAKKIYTRDELALASVLPAVSTDPQKPHLLSAFGVEMRGRGWVVGTDGERLHASACEAWRAHERRTSEGQPPPPPAEQVIPWDAPWLGAFDASRLDDARAFVGKRWQVLLELGPNAYQRAYVSASSRPGKAPDLHPFGRNGLPVEWIELEQLTFKFGINLAHVLDAIDHVGPGPIHVWAGCDPKFPGLEPVAFARWNRPLHEQDRFAVVMPVRV